MDRRPSPSVLTAVAEQFDHVGEKQPPDLHQLRAGAGALQQRGHHLQDHWEAPRRRRHGDGGQEEETEERQTKQRGRDRKKSER